MDAPVRATITFLERDKRYAFAKLDTAKQRVFVPISAVADADKAKLIVGSAIDVLVQHTPRGMRALRVISVVALATRRAWLKYRPADQGWFIVGDLDGGPDIYVPAATAAHLDSDSLAGFAALSVDVRSSKRPQAVAIRRDPSVSPEQLIDLRLRCRISGPESQTALWRWIARNGRHNPSLVEAVLAAWVKNPTQHSVAAVSLLFKFFRANSGNLAIFLRSISIKNWCALPASE